MNAFGYALRQLEQTVTFFGKDLEALTEEQILAIPMGSARKPVDFVYEAALVNLQVKSRLLNETAPGGVEEGWDAAPAELRSKAAISTYYHASAEALLDVVRAIPEKDGGRMILGRRGQTPIYELVFFAAMHNMYHDAQLNYVQQLYGDMDVHWF